ncbi:MAG: tRNA 2-selenouridine(34) synthase MnmH [Bacteroidia bacterium]|nr:tRNA 2-selenouridine(34) synthase MnmH [Bacteroidia bacterium]
MTLDIHDFLQLRRHLPVIDVRSEGEYDAGHIAGAHNLPILNNAERKAVGTDYKQRGQQEAIRTGFRLVGPRLAQLVDDTVALAGQTKEVLVHCWRGGMRSANFCNFMEMARLKTHQLNGGYKAYRQLAFDIFKQDYSLIVVGGATGSGKSEVLRALAGRGEQVLDLEDIAHHKGSVFGGLMMPPQPTTEQFQNNLFEALAPLDRSRRIWVEDESIAVGKVFLPNDFWRQLRSGPIVEIDVDKERRVQRLVNEYGVAPREEFQEAMSKVAKKLGGQHYKAALESLRAGNISATIDSLLTYYDKAYRNGLIQRDNQIILRHHYDGVHVHELADTLIGEMTARIQ